ncbi:MAG: permease prefix domain 1-containing protein [Planctomycetota bacterium]
MALSDWLRAPDPRPVEAIEADIADELAFHLEARTRDNIAAGMDPEAARRDAEARFGDFDAVHSACRRVRLGERLMLQRIHLALTCLLLLVLGATLVQLSELRGELRASAGEPTLAPLLPPPFGDVVVAIGDRLQVQCVAHSGIAAEDVVASDGHVLLPELGWVDVRGLTRPELEEKLCERYQPYFADPVDIKVRVTKSYALNRGRNDVLAGDF